MRHHNVTNRVMIRPAVKEDAPAILQMYKNVAQAHPTQITVRKDEVDLPMVKSFIEQATIRGLARVLCEDAKPVAFLKAYTSEYCRYAHILTNGTLIVDPTKVGKEYGSQLYKACVDEVIASFHHILIIETIANASNDGAARLYTRLGNTLQARLPNKTFQDNGKLDDHLVFHMTNPNFKRQYHLKYQEYLKSLRQKRST